MKKIYNRYFSVNGAMRTAFLACLVAPVLSFGQLYYQVGTGTSTNTTTGYPCPMGNWYDGLRQQQLYTASELNSAGFAAGSITEIAWDVSSMPSTVGQLDNYTVYIQTTTATSLTGWQTINTPAVYQANITPSLGWNTLALSAPFIWNGSDNILIQVCYQNSACYSYTRNPLIKYSTTTFVSTMYYRADCTAGMCTNSGFPQYSSNRPNIRFTVIPPVADDAGVKEIVSPGIGLCSLGSISTKVILSNFGSDSLTSCTVNWSVNGSTQTSFSFTGLVAAAGGVSDTVTLGNFTYSDGDSLVVWTSNPNGVQDSFPNNDTAIAKGYEALVGSYTIGGTSPDYTTIKDATIALAKRGVCGNVVMNISQGTYNEKVVVGSFPGAGPSSTITFMPVSGDTVTIMSTQNTDSNFVVKMLEAMYVTFDGLTIDGTSGIGYGTTVDISSSSYCTVSNCIINGPTGTSFSTAMNNFIGSQGEYITIEGNMINNGAYRGMSWSGGENIMVLNNTITDAYYYGAYFTGIEVVYFNGNTMTSQSAYYYGRGLYLSTIGGASQILRNKISWPSYYGGIYAYGLNGTNDERPIIANNMIWSGDGSGNVWTGAYINGGYVNVVNNTIAMQASPFGYYALYVTGGANTIMNNLIHDTTGYSSTWYASMYFGGTFAVLESDYNNIFTNRNFGRVSSAYSTLSDWQNATGFDMNSSVIDPGFVKFDSMRTCNDSLDGTGTPLTYITDDYDGDGRNPTTPDIGADEWVGSSPGSYSAGDDAIVCDGKTVEIGLAVTGGTFTWSTGDTTSTIVVSTSGTYTVTMTSACGAALGDTVEVVDVTPTSVFTNNPSFLTGQFINSSVNGDTYMWVVHVLPPDTFYSMDLTYVFPDNGPYDVDLYVRNDCDTVMSTTEWTGYVGIEDNSLENLVTLMPNPATDILNIQFTGFDGDVTIEMTNIQGQLIYTERYMNVSGNAIKSIDVSSLRKGMYIVKFLTNDEVTTKQIIVQ